MEIESLSPSKRPISENLTTVISENMSIEGDIRGAENLEIEGLVKGSIELEKCNLTIGLKGRVQGDIRARKVTISGELNGTVKALEEVKVKKAANFHGEIKAKRISVEDGAFFKGVIELDRKPQKKPAGPKKPEDTASSSEPKSYKDSPMPEDKKET